MLEIYLLVTLANAASPVAVYQTQADACVAYVEGSTKLYKEQINHKGEAKLVEGSCEVIRQFKEKK